MTNHTAANIELVREEIEAMFDNIESVKGLKHRLYIEQLFTAHQLLEISGIVGSLIAKVDPKLHSLLAEGVTVNVSKMLQISHELSGFDPSEVDALIKEGDAMVSNVRNMALAALKAGSDGYTIKE